MPYYPRIPPGCIPPGTFMPSSLLREWGASGVGGYFDRHSGKYLEDLVAERMLYGPPAMPLPFPPPAQARPQSIPSTTAGTRPSTLPRTPERSPAPSMPSTLPPRPANPDSVPYPSAGMLRAELEATSAMAQSLAEAIATRRPAPWVEYKLQLAKRRLRDSVLYLAYGTEAAQEPNPGAPGHMARRALAQIQADAEFLAEVFEEGQEPPEWVAAYVHDAHIEVQESYESLARSSMSSNPHGRGPHGGSWALTMGRGMARAQNPAGAGGIAGICPEGSDYAGVVPQPNNAWTALCTDPRSGEVISTFGSARTFPYQHLGYYGYHGY